MSGTGGSKTNFENNIFDDGVLENIAFECDEELPPTGIREESIGVLSTVSMRFMEVIQSTRERIFGEDYWIPSDPFEVTHVPADVLKNCEVIYPAGQQNVSLKIIRGGMKGDPSTPLYHVLYIYRDGQLRQSLSIYRSENHIDSFDFYRRCEECRILLRLLMLDKRKDIRLLTKRVHDITDQIHQHPLWKMAHIAIACQRLDIFTDEGLKFLEDSGYSRTDLTDPVCYPEGKYPLMLAIERNQLQIVQFLLNLGATPAACDLKGNNAVHYATLQSSVMLEAICLNQNWQETCKSLLDLPNNEGISPAQLAIRNGNFLCLKTLSRFGATLTFFSGKNALSEALQSKGTTTEVFRAVFEASPDLLTKRDEATGNTCLHMAMFKTPLMGLLYLKSNEIDLNAKNKAGLTALQLFVAKGDIGMVMTLASYGCNLDEESGCGGDTALHMAVSNRNLTITRLLLCLGANPNKTNIHGDTPRHLAARIREIDMVKSLIICGAKRCPPAKSGCVSGCVCHEHSLALLKPSLSSPASVTNILEPKTAKVEDKNPISMTTVEELENRQVKGKKKYNNSIQDAEHMRIYDEMLETLTKMAETCAQETKKDPHLINILSLDGGGIRGLVITQILMEIEKVLEDNLFKYFDWVAGTSTGALVAAGLSLGQSIRHIQRSYIRLKDQVFENWIRPYNSAILEAFMQTEIGSEIKFSDVEWPRLLFTTTRADFFPVQLELMRNYTLPLPEEENEEHGFHNPHDILLWKTLRMSSAAPTYFSWVDSKYIDGGIISNNPTLELLAEIQLWNSVHKSKKLPNEVKVGCVLSIGTGAIPTTPMDLNYNQLTLSNAYSNVVSIKNLGTIIVDQVTATEGAPVSRSSSWCITTNTPYFRFSAPLFKDLPMDTKDDLDIAQMMWNCMEYMYVEHDQILKLCKLLKEIGPSEKRAPFLKPLIKYQTPEEEQN